MAPDRGATRTEDLPSAAASDESALTTSQWEESAQFLNAHAEEGQNFSLRGILVGLAVGLVICFSNMYFGLQTGWVSSMSMPSALIGFAFFKTFSKHLGVAFTPVENVLVQTVAGSMGTMPLGCGLVGVMPALNYLLTEEESGPLFLSVWKLILWCLGLSFFGVVFAVPLRKQVIIREKLKFPSGTATALMISVLHDTETLDGTRVTGTTGVASTEEVDSSCRVGHGNSDSEALNKAEQYNWASKVRLLIISFAISGFYTLLTYFVPILRNLPIFGYTLANSWLWTLNPSLAYVGQGIIMGPATTFHMLLGAIVGWGILSPLARRKGWAPGLVDDWESGSKGWIVWISLAIMLADSVVSLGYISLSPGWVYGRDYLARLTRDFQHRGWKDSLRLAARNSSDDYAPINTGDEGPNADTSPLKQSTPDAPPEHLVNDRTIWIGLILSILFCILTIHIVFGDLVPLYATITAVFMALILSIMGVRALGETDLNPVSGISKLAQLFFALIIPQSNKNSVLINLVAGAVSEAGALQAGDLMQDLKTGHLLGAAPNAQFWGQLIGSAVGAVVSALIYNLYTSVYEVPGDLFQVPTGYVWIFTARLVTGKGLPDMAWQWAVGAAIIFAGATALRILAAGKKWHPFIPGGIAVAVGMYNVPSFTLARAAGGFMNWYWRSYKQREESHIVVLASGLILGEGVVSIVNLALASLRVPRL